MKSVVKAPLAKDKSVNVLLTREEVELVDRLVESERERRKDLTIGRGTVLRELSMPRVRELVGQKAAA